jgi:hypothetical protein
MNKYCGFLTLLFLWVCSPAVAFVQEHSCRHMLSLRTYEADGYRMDAQPGDTVCIEAGRRPFLRLKNFKGTAEKPVTFINCGGKVTMGGPAVKDAVLIMNSKHFRFTGSGDSLQPYGIHIVETKPGSQGIAAIQFSSDFEIDHLEIEKTGFAGIMAKTDPHCDGSSDRGNFTMENIKIHHNYIHHVSGEGIYLGNSFYTGTEVYCDSFHLPHTLKGVQVYNNIVEHTGWEAIQVGSAVEDCEIWGNEVRHYGTANKQTQNNGIQLGLGTTGRLYNNLIQEGKGAAIVIQGIGDNYIYNNLIISPGQEAFNINTREPLPEKGVYIINNTVVNARNGVLKEYVNPAKNNVFINNLLVDVGEDWNRLKHYTDWTLANNLVAPFHSLHFSDTSGGNYRPGKGSKVVGAGKDVSAYGIDKDHSDTPRPQGSGYDIGAFELEANIW